MLFFQKTLDALRAEPAYGGLLAEAASSVANDFGEAWASSDRLGFKVRQLVSLIRDVQQSEDHARTVDNALTAATYDIYRKLLDEGALDCVEFVLPVGDDDDHDLPLAPMLRYTAGPNGATLRLKDHEYATEYIYIQTPGQMSLFRECLADALLDPHRGFSGVTVAGVANARRRLTLEYSPGMGHGTCQLAASWESEHACLETTQSFWMPPALCAILVHHIDLMRGQFDGNHH